MNHYSILRLFLLVILISGCYDRQVQASLNTAEECLQDHPDSALQILRQLPIERLRSSSQKAHRALLLSMALDKCYIDIADDSLARIAVQYYSTRKDRRKAMLSWYSLGRVQVNAENPGGAIISFKQAEADAETVDDKHYLGLIKQNIGALYASQEDAKEASYYYGQAVSCFQRTGEPLYRVYAQYSLAMANYALGRVNVCDSLLHELELHAIANDMPTFLSLVKVAKGTTLLLNSPKNAADAKSIMLSGLSGNSRIHCQEACYLMLASTYLRQKDSSEAYRKIAFQEARTSRDSSRLYSALYKMKSYEKQYREALEYQDLSMSIQNRIMNRRESLIISNSLADYHTKEAQRAREYVKKQRIIILLIVISFVLLVLFLLQRLQYRIIQNKEKDRIISEQESRIQEDLEQSGEILEEVKHLQQEKSKVLSSLATSVLGQMELVNKWADIYNSLTKTPSDPYRHLDQDYIEERQEVINRFCTSLDPIRNNDKWYGQVEEWVNQFKNGIMARARRACYQPGKRKQIMDDSDFKTLLLMYTGLSDKTISYFQGLAYGTVRMRRMRYRELFSKMESEDGAILLEALITARVQ